eukprot:9821687-Prorocentrum_lima.AAC.1
MTSSLVGSEMCIRDSPSGPVPLPTGSLPTRYLLRSVIAVLARFARPVSYTHLTLPTICSV